MVPLLWLILAALSRSSWSCNRGKTDDGYICICDESYCDTVPTLEGTIHPGWYTFLSTAHDELGFVSSTGPLSYKDNRAVVIVDVSNNKRQTMVGFGGAMTDSAALTIDRLPEGLRLKLLENYFGEEGSRYSMLRVPIGVSDYSTRYYSYDDDHPDDRNLTYFQLQPEDIDHKIPNILQAMKLRNGSLNLFATMWTPPLWMKNVERYSSFTYLKPEYYQLLADYHLKFFKEYKKRGITFWGLTTGNEPINGITPPGNNHIPAMAWVPYQQMNWIIENLGPTLKKFQDNLNILIHDDCALSLIYVVPLMLNNTEALKYIDGVGVHIYDDHKIPPAVLRFAETNNKEILHLVTEACYFVCAQTWFGSWRPADHYSNSILMYLQEGYQGYVDWNLVVDINGGPSFIGNVVHAPIVISGDAREFYKNPLFYVMAHFSKYLTPGSVILNSTLIANSKNDKFKFVAFERPDKLRGVIAYNGNKNALEIQVRDQNIYTGILVLPGYSINTVLYNLG